MSQFSLMSESRLVQAHPDLQVLFNEVVKWYDCTIADSYRTKEKQEEYFRIGLSKVHYPTVHNTKPSNAVDVYPYEGDHVDFTKLQSAFFAGWVLGIASQLYADGKIHHRIRSGADWDKDNDVDDNTFWDAGHFEIIPNEGDVFQYFES